jgi:Cu(I)/Ag(I) efflux system periplasmic protein CusF
MDMKGPPTMNKLLVALSLALAAGASLAQTFTDAEVRKVDKAQGKLTLRHGEIKNLEMPAMTMVFRVKDPKMLETLAEGHKVQFTAEKIDGQYVVTLIRPAP